MKILIKGAGDLATGIASRLYHSGHTILMTELPEPLTVRRSVAFSRAVYEKEAKVEDMLGILAHSYKEIRQIQESGNIAVYVDAHAEIEKQYCPDVVIDAILAKRNLGTRIDEAPFVIGAGPGFTAGEDCHCVVETKRGHTLGNIIWRGSAIPNTGVPGNIGGYTTERLIRASAAGKVKPAVQIGDYVEKGQVVAETGGKPVYAQMSGIVRGMLQADAEVTENLKIGDIDARCEKGHCYTISDKARAIGGGVLEAVMTYERMKNRYAVVVLAAGIGARFGGDKLTAELDGVPLYRRMLEKLSGFSGFPRVLVTGSEVIKEEAERYGVRVVENKKPELGISHSLKLGLEACLKENKEIRGILFSVCDQPYLQFSTMFGLIRSGMLHPGSIICTGTAMPDTGDGKENVQSGNPVFWDKKYFPELMSLTGDVGGKQVMKRHKEDVLILETDREELRDIDRKEDLNS